MTTLRKIISGGQTGVDQAALRAAAASSLETGGWCPPGRMCETGLIPEEFRLHETERERSPDAPDVPRSQRTEWNVRDSDATLVIVPERAPHPPSPGFGVVSTEVAAEDPGTEWAMECAKRYGRPLLVCELSDPNAKQAVREWLGQLPITVLSVGGPAESTSPGIGERTYRFLCAVLDAGFAGNPKSQSALGGPNPR